jgi:hypothetical protein
MAIQDTAVRAGREYHYRVQARCSTPSALVSPPEPMCTHNTSVYLLLPATTVAVDPSSICYKPALER